MWCILVGFFTFFLFGSIYGTLVLFLNLTCLVAYLMLADEVTLASKGLTEDQVGVRMVVNVLYVTLALSFIVYKMMQNNDEMIGRYEAQTKQNDILLKEVHHRVKNNLQIVSSLLRLQAAENNNEKVISQFEEAIGRIRSMALIHEKMYVNEDFSSIDVDSYIKSLVHDISQSIHTECKVELVLSADVRQVDIKSVVPLSLLLNELITNSIRHGFENHSRATIEISLEEAGDKVLLYYSDSGTWKEGTVSGFGLELIKTLTEQLYGSYERTLEDGTHYRFVLDADEFFFRKEEE
jgi:two-component sensor histidine kinase